MNKVSIKHQMNSNKRTKENIKLIINDGNDKESRR
jgi:hypothetical protein